MGGGGLSLRVGLDDEFQRNLLAEELAVVVMVSDLSCLVTGDLSAI